MDRRAESKVCGDERVGTTLCGKYRLDRLLAVGGMAAVYQATHRNGHRVAVKILLPEVATNPEIRRRFLREGRVANQVEHPGSTRVLDDDIDPDGSVFLVMELLEGETLEARFLRLGPLPHAEVASLAYQLLDTLVAAHEQGIVHRDIKPENLFLTREGILKVLDFGIAHLRQIGAPTSPMMTVAGIMLGTPAYMPPEQALGRTDQIDARTDLWAVGATLFWLLSGRHVHEGQTSEELVVFSGSRPARPLASVAAFVPAALAAVVDGALAFDKERRWPSARAMQEALERAYPRWVGAPPRGLSAESGVAPGATAGDSTGTKTLLGVIPFVPARAPRPTAVVRGDANGWRGWRRGRRTLIGVGALAAGACALALALHARSGFAILPAALRPSTVPAGLDRYRAAAPSATKLTAHSDRAAAPNLQSDSEPGGVVHGQWPKLSAEPRTEPRGPSAASGPGTRRVVSSRRAESTACDPPYTVDPIGRRIPKPQCL